MEREKEGVKRRLLSLNGMKAKQENGKAFRPGYALDSEPMEYGGRNGKIDSIEIRMKSDIVCSNHNRVAILHLLKRDPKKEMQAEKIAQALGVSHRTALYHLDILEDYELVEVRGFRKKGKKMLRSVWGLNTDSRTEKVLCIICRKFPPEKIRKIIKTNGYANGCARRASQLN